jgi:hypothetical protein
MRGHLRRLTISRSHGLILGDGARLSRLDENLPDVGEADEPEDLFQISALLIATFCARTRAICAAARTDHYEGLARDEPLVTFPRREAVRQPPVHEQINIVLQFIRDAEIPHLNVNQFSHSAFLALLVNAPVPPNDHVHRARDSILMVIAKPDARAPVQQLLSGPPLSGMTPREQINDFRTDAGRMAFGDDGA